MKQSIRTANAATRWAGIFLLSAAMANSADAGGKSIQIGYTVEGYGVKNVEMEKEVAVALDVLLSHALKRTGHVCKFQHFDNEKDLLAQLLAGKQDMADLSAFGYASLTEEERGRLMPIFVPQMSRDPEDRIVLLAKPGASLESLRGKRLRIYKGIDRGLGRRWLEHELGGAADGFFGETAEYPRSEEVLLPTFFGKADACLVREENYRLLSELNPQVAQRLQPVLTSPGYSFSLVVARKDLNPETMTNLTRLVGNLRSDPRARQAFTLLRVESLRNFDPKLMASVIDLAKKVLPERPEPDPGETLLATPGEALKGETDVNR